MALILNLETATTVCSVSLAKDGDLLTFKEHTGDYSHAENLTLFIDDVFQQAKLKLSDIDAVAVSKGPGSYTGLRIGVSTAKGLCYSLNKPLIAINTLQHLSLALSEGEGTNPARISPRYFTAGKLDWSSSVINAKENRKNQTEAEKIIWQHLRANKLEYKFRRQHPIDKYIVDFACIEKRLIIEIDGKIHDHQIEEDAIRTEELIKCGFKVIRFKNEQVIVEIDNVIKAIRSELKNSISPLSFGEGRGEVLFCPMIDARRMEVYCAIYNSDNKEIKTTAAEIIDENSFADLLETNQVIFFGDGADKCKSILSKNKNAIFIDGIFLSAKNMISLSEQAFINKQFEDAAYFEPFYLKDFVAGKKKENS
ncbi:MAG: tRNA (adenosine(37)-N6)-threonylcarbamoyltransferase complex dimerization subunit type 1 TsaB [Bacteroidota bacterium]